MSRAPRDVGRSDAYAAEDAAFEGTVLERAPGGAALQAAVTTMLAASWWRTHAGDPAVVRRVRVRAASDSHWAPASGTLAIDPAEPWYVVTHELAHVVDGSGSQAHGEAWRAWNVALVAAAFGEPFARLLADSFARHGLPYAERTPRPPAVPLLDVAAPAARGGWQPRR